MKVFLDPEIYRATIALIRDGNESLDTPSRHKNRRPWPRRMKALDAAYYCGVSRTTFLRGVDDGIYPKPTV